MKKIYLFITFLVFSSFSEAICQFSQETVLAKEWVSVKRFGYYTINGIQYYGPYYTKELVFVPKIVNTYPAYNSLWDINNFNYNYQNNYMYGWGRPNLLGEVVNNLIWGRRLGACW